MDQKERRKELLAQYKQNPPEAGVYRIVNTQNNRMLVASSTNLAGVRNKLQMGRTHNMPGVLDYRLAADARRYGMDAFAFEVLDVLESKPERTEEQTRADLATLEALWRERLDPSLLY